jgi:putative dimethyl sulfoxide reductase chaperone
MNQSAARDADVAEQLAAQRGQIYELLSIIFGREPTRVLLQQVHDVAPQLNDLGITCQDKLSTRPLDEQLTELEVEYTRLFIGPGPHIALQESVQRGEGQLWGESTCNVVQCYTDTGFVMHESFPDLPDHLAVELQYCGLLAKQETARWQAGDPTGAMRIVKTELQFLNEHLLQWGPGVSQRVREEARWAFYRAYADMLECVLHSDVTYLQGLCSTKFETTA